uniref:Uncharacterized protein n=1 Tax=Oryza nivara TaxID=4536 RepID=A0A0E0FGI6_ORYNI
MALATGARGNQTLGAGRAQDNPMQTVDDRTNHRSPEMNYWRMSRNEAILDRFNTVRKSKDANCCGISPESSFDEISNDSS